MNRGCGTVCGALLAAVCLLPVCGRAESIIGNLVLTESNANVVAVSSRYFDMDYDSGGTSGGTPPLALGAVNGGDDNALFDIGESSSGSFAGVGATATVYDLDYFDAAPLGQKVGTIVNLSNFVTFTSDPGWSITLTEILPGAFGTANCTGTPAPGQDCTPVFNSIVSPFNMINEGGNQVSMSFAFLGSVTDGLGDSSPVSGSFATTFSNTNLQAVVAAIAGGGAVVSGFTGTIEATVAEPGSFSEMLTGVAFLAGAIVVRRQFTSTL